MFHARSIPLSALPGPVSYFVLAFSAAVLAKGLVFSFPGLSDRVRGSWVVV